MWGFTGDSETSSFLREAFILQKQFTNDPARLADIMRLYAGSLSRTNRDDAETLYRDALVLHRKNLEPNSPGIAADLFSLGQLLLRRNKVDEAATVLREAFGMYQKIYDKNHVYQPIVLRLFAESLVRQGKGDEAEAIVHKMVDANPEILSDWELLGLVEAYRGNWTIAAEQFLRSHSDGFQAVALFESGRYEDYRRLSREFLYGVHGPIRDIGNRAFLLEPVAEVDLNKIEQVADRSVTRTEEAWIEPMACMDKALAEYRANRFDLANEWARRAINENARLPNQAQAWFVQALACARLQQFESGRIAFAKGEALLREPQKQWDLLWNLPEWMIAETLEREAGALIKSNSENTNEPKQNLR
jgi:tetratricopeptide (TPR) repeat protein